MKQFLLMGALCTALLTSGCNAVDAAKSYVPTGNGPSVEAYFSPGGQVQSHIVNKIERAQKSIDVMAYSFTSKPIAEALIAAKQRGVAIRVITDKTQKKEKYTVIHELAQAGIPIWLDLTVSIQHNKIMIIDNRELITGSYNFTRSAEVRNAENCLFIKNDYPLIDKYAQYFQKRLRVSTFYEGPQP